VPCSRAGSSNPDQWCRRCGCEGHHPLYRARRTLHTGADLLTDKQKDRLLALFAADEHLQVEATWTIYQQMIAAYREPDRTRGRALMVKLIESLSHGVPAALMEPRRVILGVAPLVLPDRLGQRPVASFRVTQPGQCPRLHGVKMSCQRRGG